MAKKAEKTKVAEIPTISVGRAANADCPAGKAGLKITSKGCDKYAPRVVHTEEAWAKCQKALGHNQLTTYGDLCTALAVHFTRMEENHHDFIGYMVQHNKLKYV